MLNFGFSLGKGSSCSKPPGEFLVNWSFDCGLMGWQPDPDYLATVTDNGDGSIHVKADTVWGSVQPMNHSFPAGDYTVRIGISSITGNGKFSYKVGATWFTHSPLVVGENIFSFTSLGDMTNFVVGADNDISFEADVMYISMRDTNATMQLIPCDVSGWTISDSDHWVGYEGVKAFNCTASLGGDTWVSGQNDDNFPKYLQAGRLNDEEVFLISSIQMKGRSTISNEHMDARRPDPLVLQGSNDGTIWDEIGRWTNTGPWNKSEVKTFDVSDGSSGHSRFRFVWEDNGGEHIDGAQMGWVKLFGVALPNTVETIIYNGEEVVYNGERVYNNG